MICLPTRISPFRLRRIWDSFDGCARQSMDSGLHRHVEASLWHPAHRALNPIESTRLWDARLVDFAAFRSATGSKSREVWNSVFIYSLMLRLGNSFSSVSESIRRRTLSPGVGVDRNTLASQTVGDFAKLRLQ